MRVLLIRGGETHAATTVTASHAFALLSIARETAQTAQVNAAAEFVAALEPVVDTIVDFFRPVDRLANRFRPLAPSARTSRLRLPDPPPARPPWPVALRAFG